MPRTYREVVEPRGSSRWLVPAMMATLVVAFVAFAPALRGPMLFDDAWAIQDNPSIRQLWPVTVPLTPPAGSAVTGRPVVNFTFALNYAINDVIGVDQRPDAGDSNGTVGYHLVNVLIQLLSGLLLFGIIRRTLRTIRLRERWSERADATALIIMALWLVHPLQTDAVDYLVQRTELVVSLCYLATLYAAIRSWDATGPASRRRWFVAGVASCLLGMGSKEVMVTAPLMVMLYDRAFLMDSWREFAAPQHRGRRVFYLALALTWLPLGAFILQDARGPSVGFDAGVPWYEYLHSQGWAIAHYLRLAFWPSGLSFDYGSNPVAHWRGIPGLLLLVTLGVGTIVAWTRANRWGSLAFLGSWFFLILAPSSSVVPIVTEIAADRRVHLALAAVIALVVAGGMEIVGRSAATAQARARRSIRGSLVAGAAVTLALALLTFRRSHLYRDPEAIWRDALREVPANSRAWYNLGVAVATAQVPNPAEADSLYRGAVKIAPDYADAILRVVVDDLDRDDFADAAKYLRQYPLASGNDTVLAGLGKALFQEGDTTGALMVLERADDQPSTAATLENLAVLYLTLGREADAVKTFRRAVAMAPERTDLIAFVGGKLLDEGHPDQALPYLEEVVRRQPDSAALRARLEEARALLRKQNR